MKHFFALCALFIFFANSAVAAVPSITRDQFDKIVEEFTANTAYTSASPPSSFGKKLLPWLGFELGIVAGVTKTPDLDNIVAEKVDKIPHLGFFTGFSGPYGLALESVFIPEKRIKDLSLTVTGIAAKWTVTDQFWTDLPVKLGVKAHWAKTTISHSQTIQNNSTANLPVDATVELADEVYGMNASVGYELFGFIEPYAGLGYLTGEADGRVTANTTATIFVGDGFAGTETSVSSSPSSAQIFAGVQFNFLAANLAVEATRAYGTNRYTLKLSADF